MKRRWHSWRMRRSLDSFQAGELTPAASSRLGDHVGRCGECAESLERLDAADRALSEARPEPPPLRPEVASAILSRALAESASHRRSHVRLRAFAWALPALGAAAGAVFLSPLWPRSAAPKAPGPSLAAVRPAPPADTGPEARPDPHVALPAPVVEQRQPPLVIAATKVGTEKRLLSASPAPKPRTPGRVHAAAARRPPQKEDKGQVLPLLAAGEPVGEAGAPAEHSAPDFRADGRLVVTASGRQPAVLVASRQAPEEAPGYARASAYHQDSSGGVVVMQCTVSTDKPEAEVVLIRQP